MATDLEKSLWYITMDSYHTVYNISRNKKGSEKHQADMIKKNPGMKTELRVVAVKLVPIEPIEELIRSAQPEV